jgi:hypothetical protein
MICLLGVWTRIISIPCRSTIPRRKLASSAAGREPGRYKERVSDAIVNGVHYEFRNITGKAEKIERRFSEAKEKDSAINVFINVDSNVSKDEARRRIGGVLGRHPDYTGKIIVSFKGKKTYFWDSGSFR